MAASGRSRADPLLVAALASGLPIGEAARLAGLGERTVRRRLADPGFRAQVKAEQQQVVEATVAALGAASLKAVTTLVGLLEAPTPPAVRHAAAKSILELGTRLRADLDVEARLGAVEAMLAEERSGHGRH